MFESFEDLWKAKKKVKYCVYTDNELEIARLKPFYSNYENILICSSQVFEEKASPVNNKVMEIERKIESFAEYVMREKLFDLKKIVKENANNGYYKLRLDELVESVCTNLKQKIRGEYSSQYFHRLIVNTTRP